VPATQSAAEFKRRQTWLDTNWRREQAANKETTKHQRPTLAALSFPSISGNYWIIYTPLRLALCVRERGICSALTPDMPCPAAVRAAAAAVWLLAVLGPGLSLPAEDDSDSLCSHCFYRQTPPRGASAGLLCHSLPEGRAFATLSRPACGTAVFSAFHLSLGRAEEEGDELVVRAHLSYGLMSGSLFLSDGIRRNRTVPNRDWCSSIQAGHGGT